MITPGGVTPVAGLSIPHQGTAAAPALVAHTAVHTAGAVTPAIDTTGATLLVCVVANFNAGGGEIPTDSKSNIWAPLTPRLFAGDSVYGQLSYVATPTVGTGHTFTSPASFASIAVAAFSGTAHFVADLDVGSTGTGGTVQPGSGTPAHPNEVIVTGLANAQALTAIVGSGFTITDQIVGNPGSWEGCALAYLLQGAAAAVNPAWAVATLQGAAMMGSWQ